MKTLKIKQIISVSLSIAFLQLPFLSTQSALAESNKNNTKATQCVTFNPDQTKHELKKEEFLVEVVDSKIIISGGETIDLKDKKKEPMDILWTIDAINCQYFAKKIKSSQNNTNKSLIFGENDKLSPSSYAIYYGYRGFRIATLDPVNIPEAYTYNKIWWTEDSNGTLQLTSRHAYCEAISPTLANTHWYNSNCSLPWSYNGNYTSLSSTATGNYYNYDFADPNQATYAWHTINITANAGGTFSYSYNWSHWGEVSSFLHGSLQ